LTVSYKVVTPLKRDLQIESQIHIGLERETDLFYLVGAGIYFRGHVLDHIIKRALKICLDTLSGLHPPRLGWLTGM